MVDQNIRAKIIKSCGLSSFDIVLEIGSGRGEMTGLICEQADSVYALEIDSALCDILKSNLSGRGNLTVINQDVLKFDFKKYFQAVKKKIIVVGNIPYYITTAIIEMILDNKEKIDTAFLTVQKEFAQRIISKSGSKEYGSFSCFLRYYTEPQIMFHISKTCFRPVPKVDSSLLKLTIRQAPTVKTQDESMLFKIIRAGFNKRRKTLRNSLKDIVPPETLEQFFKKYSIDKNTRPERLSLEDFSHLADMMSCPG